MTAAPARTGLPEPRRHDRWQPLRAGLVDLFYYDAEEFHFHDGRLLLRGNNGTGKSKVLALLLPFLLDGDLSPYRVEPDADPKKKMEWNLLLGGEHPHPERIGYSWLEFGRLTDDGAEYRTLGCGMKAVSGRGIARHWYLVTDQRIGLDLHLLDGTRTALGRDRLIEAVGGRGRVFDRARDYRRSVDEELFGLGEQRYSALVDLLVHLRQPQLSKRPSEKALSAALTEALPPLDQAVVADVAEAFRSLESDRDELTAMIEARDSARGFLGHYRRYAAVAARRAAADPRRAETRHRKARDELADAEQAFREADEAAGDAAARLREIDGEVVRLRAREGELRTGPEMRTAEGLRQLEQEAERRRDDAERTAARRADADALRDRRAQRLDRSTIDLQRAETALAAATADARAAADPALLGTAHREIDEIVADDPGQAREISTRAVARQERALAHVRGLLAGTDRALLAERTARSAVERLDSESDRLAERQVAAGQAVADLGGELVREATAQLRAAVELRPGDPASLLAELELWVETLAGPNPLTAATDLAGRAATGELARADAEIGARLAETDRRAAELAAEISRLEAGEHIAPPVPHTRGAEVRDGRDGAPFWQLVDFADGVGERERAGLEAALEASGVLDAWLSPDGSLLGADDDVLVAPTVRVTHGPGLTGLLRPAVDRADPRAAPVSDATVTAVLRAIAQQERADGTWVGTDGRFGNGVLHGSWHKDHARYVGRGAREAARRTLLEQRRAEAEELAAAGSVLRTEEQRLIGRRTVLAAELAALPDDTAVREAHATVSALATQRADLGVEQAEVRAAHEAAAELSRQARAALDTGAADVGLPSTPDELEAVRVALSEYRVLLADIWPASSTTAGARVAEQDAAAELADAEEQVASASALAGDAAEAALAAEEAYVARRETVGAQVAELHRQLSEVADLLSGLARDRSAYAEAREAAIAGRGHAEGLRQAAEHQVADAVRDREAAAESLRRFARTRLIEVAVPDLEVPPVDDTWAADPAVRLARQIDQALDGTSVDDGNWDRVQRRVTEELKTLSDTLSRHGNTASAQLLDAGIIVEIVFRGRPTAVPELADALDHEVTDRQRLLDEREREILENHLVSEVAGALQELISDSDRQVARMNEELADRPTSTGMRLKLEWRAREDGPAGLEQARRRLLRQSSDAWSPEDREAVGRFLQERIAEMRSRDGAGTWLDHLTAALDYRAWHRFAIFRRQNGQWRPATGPASGGERVLAASVPLFAAASAHYASAGNPHAPRLVTLDEAFAGVDDNARAKYLGLLAAFDLDVVMTSEREWGCYPEVPGLSIAQLARADGVPAVLVTNWRWDGLRRERVERPAALPVPETPREPALLEQSLFDEP
ncbi:TIGR02680 family protein [Pseudonocardia sp. NPDC046786]|uniref:TIGR02680 family protein n=1 Tax=Pseudonocardia sp. NPDC046786 TaxID=3155471 RepID=UPI0033FE24B3